MKRDAVVIEGPIHGLAIGQAAKAAFVTMAGWLKRFGNVLSRIIVQMQISRMNSVLQSMSDSQLKEIGIRRDEIGAYAKGLISHDGADV